MNVYNTIIGELRAAIKDYPGSYQAVAARLKTPADELHQALLTPARQKSLAAVLRNKINDGARNRLSLEDFVELTEVLGPYPLLSMLAGAYGYVLVPADPDAQEGDLLAMALSLAARKGEFAAELSTSVADGHVTPREYEQLQHKWASLQQAAVGIFAAARALMTRAPGVGR